MKIKRKTNHNPFQARMIRLSELNRVAGKSGIEMTQDHPLFGNHSEWPLETFFFFIRIAMDQSRMVKLIDAIDREQRAVWSDDHMEMYHALNTTWTPPVVWDTDIDELAQYGDTYDWSVLGQR